jgi:hypothetical protein
MGVKVPVWSDPVNTGSLGNAQSGPNFGFRACLAIRHPMLAPCGHVPPIFCVLLKALKLHFSQACSVPFASCSLIFAVCAFLFARCFWLCLIHSVLFGLCSCFTFLGHLWTSGLHHGLVGGGGGGERVSVPRQCTQHTLQHTRHTLHCRQPLRRPPRQPLTSQSPLPQPCPEAFNQRQDLEVQGRQKAAQSRGEQASPSKEETLNTTHTDSPTTEPAQRVQCQTQTQTQTKIELSIIFRHRSGSGS